MHKRRVKISNNSVGKKHLSYHSRSPPRARHRSARVPRCQRPLSSCSVLQCCVLYYTTPHNTTPFTIPYNAIHVTPHRTKLYHTTTPHRTAPHHTSPHQTILAHVLCYAIPPTRRRGSRRLSYSRRGGAGGCPARTRDEGRPWHTTPGASFLSAGASFNLVGDRPAQLGCRLLSRCSAAEATRGHRAPTRSCESRNSWKCEWRCWWLHSHLRESISHCSAAEATRGWAVAKSSKPNQSAPEKLTWGIRGRDLRCSHHIRTLLLRLLLKDPWELCFAANTAGVLYYYGV